MSLHRPSQSAHHKTRHDFQDQALERTFLTAVRLAEQGRCAEALGHLATAISSDQIRNARAVCLMRSGSVTAALEMLRGVVFRPGTLQQRDDIPVIYQTNFCTVLLLTGRPGGCREVLAEIRDQQHPSVLRLRETLRKWEKTLPFFQWLNWKMGVAPSVPVPVEFTPGEFIEPSSTTAPDNESAAASADPSKT
ncbi:MAG: hypothetical protein KDA96_03320 [Planctomycetaceae bacterium]|nr:hypothetical protein [Planctomycetaceae bacterium]